MAVITPDDHPRSVCNRCVIESFGGVSYFHICFNFLLVKGLLS